MNNSALLENVFFAQNELDKATRLLREVSLFLTQITSSFTKKNSGDEDYSVAFQVLYSYYKEFENTTGDLEKIETKLAIFSIAVRLKRFFRQDVDLQGLKVTTKVLQYITQELRTGLANFFPLSQESDDKQLLVIFMPLVQSWSLAIKNLEKSLEYLEGLTDIREKKLPKINWGFVKNLSLRAILERDYQELETLLQIKATKSVIVISGSILEGILVGVLRPVEQEAQLEYKKQFPTKREIPLERWALYDLTCVAAGLKIIKPDTQKTSDFVRNYRNIVHPSVEIRENATVDDELALVIVTLLKRVLRDVTL